MDRGACTETSITHGITVILKVYPKLPQANWSFKSLPVQKQTKQTMHMPHASLVWFVVVPLF
jgi:hypothetical protein